MSNLDKAKIATINGEELDGSFDSEDSGSADDEEETAKKELKALNKENSNFELQRNKSRRQLFAQLTQQKDVQMNFPRHTIKEPGNKAKAPVFSRITTRASVYEQRRTTACRDAG